MEAENGWMDRPASPRTPRSPADEFIASLPRSHVPDADDTRIADECALGMPEEPTKM